MASWTSRLTIEVIKNGPDKLSELGGQEPPDEWIKPISNGCKKSNRQCRTNYRSINDIGQNLWKNYKVQWRISLVLEEQNGFWIG